MSSTTAALSAAPLPRDEYYLRKLQVGAFLLEPRLLLPIEPKGYEWEQN